VGIVITGLVNYRDLAVPDPIAVTVNAAGPALAGLRPVIKLGALFGLTSVIVVLILGQARIFFAMADDGNLPRVFARVHPVYKTPYVTTLVTGVAAAALAGLLPVDVLSELVSIGTLSAFVVVCVGVVALRRTRPELRRPFAVPCSPYLPAAGAALSLVQIAVLPVDTLWRLCVWMAAGALVYLFYSRKHAKPWEEVYGRLLREGAAGGGEGEEGGKEGGGEGAGAGAASAQAQAQGGKAAPAAASSTAKGGAVDPLPPATLDW
jgi:APA family basic amino acid/polyamine antiporter